MSIESEVFKRREFDESRLAGYGFERQGNALVCRRELRDGFYGVLSYLYGEMKGKVYDPETEEEYTVFRLEGVSGAFVVGIKNAYISWLEEVRDLCSTERMYLTEQSARIAAAISARYGASPEYLWKRFPHYAVFRNADTRKWFAIKMDLDRSKVTPLEFGATDVMNVKLDSRTKEYIAKGAFPSFHMNAGHWVSLILDDRMSDELVLEMVEISYRLSFGKKRR